MRRTILTISLLAALLTGAAASAQTTVELREAALVAAGPVRLDQVADVSGPDAQRLGAVVVCSADAAATTLSRSAVKAALDAANPPVSWARTLLRGGDIALTIAAPPAPAPAPAPALAPIFQPADPVRTVATQNETPTASAGAGSLRTLIYRALCDAAGVDPSQGAITMRTDNLSTADQQLVAQAVPPTWKCRIQVLGATPAGRTQVRIEAYETDRVAVSRTLTIDALVTRDILVVAAPGGLAREQVIASTDLRFDRRTIPVNESARLASVTTDALIGSVVKRRLDQGKPILPTDVSAPKSATPPVVVKRGDDVTVSCIAGGVILKTKAKALGPARDGELVTLQVDGSKKSFTARMNGPGKAVMALESDTAN